MSFHLYDVKEIYSNDSGTVQFIELSVGNVSGEHQWNGVTMTISNGTATKTYLFTANLPSADTANTSFLIATQGFENLDNGLVPDFIMPAGQLLLSGQVTITFSRPGQAGDTVSYQGAALLALGDTQSLNRAGSTLSVTAVAEPKNFAGNSVMLGEPNEPPTGAVTISGTTTEGEVLTADAGSLQDGNGLGAFAYQWLRNGSPIDGATDPQYTLADADAGASISVRVSYTDGDGHSEQVTSAETDAIAGADDGPTGNVTVQGVVAVGQQLVAETGSIGDVDGLGPFSYQWLRSGEPIDGATGSIYTIVQADAGSTLSVRVSYLDGAGTHESLASEPTAPVPGDAHSLDGTSGDDHLVGTSSGESIRGLAGNDLLEGGGGDDTLDGGAGTDTADLGVPLAQIVGYSIGPAQIDVQLASGNLVLTGIERVALDDAYFAFDTHEGETVWHAQALLWAAFGAAPSQSLLSQWTTEGDDAGGLTPLAQAMLDFYAPGVSSQVLVTHLFGTLLHVAPTQAQLEQFTGMIGAGQTFETPADFLAFAATHEINTVRFAGFAGTVQPLDVSFF